MEFFPVHPVVAMKKISKQKSYSAVHIEVLEPRLLFSADIFAGAVEGGTAVDPVADELEAITTQIEHQVTALPLRTELVLVDTATEDYQQLIDDLFAQADDTRQLEVVLLDTEQDGIAQISGILADYSNLDAIHIISHGSDGQIQLGTGQINLEDLQENQAAISGWASALNEEADLLIYGCNLASSNVGTLFINTLAQLTHADVAASDDLTGNAYLGGDWELEVTTGSIETTIAFSTQVQQTWSGVLAEPTAANNTIITDEDTPYTFIAADFNYSDIDSDPMASVEVTSLESVGALLLSGVDVTLNQAITKADIDAGNLTFVPVGDENGVSYDSFGFSVNDGTADSASTYTMIIDVTAVNDAPTFSVLPTFTAHTITTSADLAYSVTTVDMDGDGDLDVLSASFNDDKIAWYENDGSETFTAHTITTAANGARSVTTADVDGDGDLDVLSASSNDDKIAWYENDGSETFTAHTITTTANGAADVTTADVDGDGDLDVLSASFNDDKITWYENDGSETFTAHTITTSANGAADVTTADVDGDGDLDVLSASPNDDKIMWFENDGSETFTAHTITTAADKARSVTTADVDGDGDLDVVSASANDDKIAWYENDGSETFTAHTITTTVDGAIGVTTADVDGDGDLDVLSASNLDDKIVWYENDGSETFTAHTITTTANGAIGVTTADVDGDGDLDVLSASNIDDKIAWYESDG
ncbi:MAG: FG-GAP-like repeat-containing protein, partial [Porticoccus sp.]|nr:FG-GAP-like repeat-containing protein [Porticoccus sp.]